MDSASTAFLPKPDLTPERRELCNRLDAKGTAPLWEVLGAIISSEPTPQRLPALWHQAQKALGVWGEWVPST